LWYVAGTDPEFRLDEMFMPSTSIAMSPPIDPALITVLCCMAVEPPTSKRPMLTLGKVAPMVW